MLASSNTYFFPSRTEVGWEIDHISHLPNPCRPDSLDFKWWAHISPLFGGWDDSVKITRVWKKSRKYKLSTIWINMNYLVYTSIYVYYIKLFHFFVVWTKRSCCVGIINNWELNIFLTFFWISEFYYCYTYNLPREETGGFLI